MHPTRGARLSPRESSPFGRGKWEWGGFAPYSFRLALLALVRRHTAVLAERRA